MITFYEWMLAFRYLRARKEEGFISVVAWFSLIGIALGVATLIVVMSVMNGFRIELMDKILGVNGHITISSSHEGIHDYPELVAKLSQIEGVKIVTPIVEGQALASSSKQSTGALVKGIRKNDLESKKVNAETVSEGSIENFGAGDGVLLGVRLADKLGLKVGDDITLISPKGLSSVMGVIPRTKSYNVIGLFEVGMYDYDSATIIMPLEQAQIYFQYRDTVSDIELRLGDPSMAQIITKNLVKTLSPDFTIYDWQRANSHLVNALNVERNVMFMILMLIILIAAFNIISSMIMLVKDKARDIAILRTMGATRGSIMKIFLITGSSIGVVGTISGFVLGISFALNIEAIRQWLQGLLHTELFSAEIYYLTQLPAEVNSTQVVTVVVSSLVLSILATIYPAWKAAKLNLLRLSDMVENILELREINRIFEQGGEKVRVLENLNLAIAPGEMVALVGSSGSGKSTLLQVAGLLDKPDSGKVIIEGKDYSKELDFARTKSPAQKIGFIYQFHHLLPEFSALENIMMPLLITGENAKEAKSKATQLLNYVGLAERAKHRPARLSGGEQQRVAILRAIVSRPSLILADEPTGNLDPSNSRLVFELLYKLVKETGIAALIATHNMELAEQMDRVVYLQKSGD